MLRGKALDINLSLVALLVADDLHRNSTKVINIGKIALERR